MAIIKNGRINIWDAVKKQFETVHPETEVARITDFADGIVQKLALTSAMAAITELQKDSWFGKLLKMALTASGVKYSIAQNGYVCFGDLFGGLIIQWGTTTDKGWNKDYWECSFPISMTATCGISIQRCYGGGCYSPIIVGISGQGFHWTDSDTNGKHGIGDEMSYIVVGK